jgi:hypothetical protein
MRARATNFDTSRLHLFYRTSRRCPCLGGETPYTQCLCISTINHSMAASLASRPQHHGSSVAADATFLETVDVDPSSSVEDLHRSNLLRIQAQQLIDECSIAPDKQWVKVAHQYLEHVSNVVSNINVGAELQRTGSLQPPFSTRLSDQKISPASIRLNDPLTVSSLPHPFLGLSTPAGNAQVLPTLTLQVKIPASTMEAKDYLRYRYFDVSSEQAWSCSCFFQSTILASLGSLYSFVETQLYRLGGRTISPRQ